MARSYSTGRGDSVRADFYSVRARAYPTVWRKSLEDNFAEMREKEAIRVFRRMSDEERKGLARTIYGDKRYPTAVDYIAKRGVAGEDFEIDPKSPYHLKDTADGIQKVLKDDLPAHTLFTTKFEVKGDQVEVIGEFKSPGNKSDFRTVARLYIGGDDFPTKDSAINMAEGLTMFINENHALDQPEGSGLLADRRDPKEAETLKERSEYERKRRSGNRD